MYYNSSGSHNGTFTYFHIGQESSISTYGSATSDSRSLKFIIDPNRIFIIGKTSARSDKHIVLDYGIGRNIYIGLYADIVSDDYIPFDDSVGSNQNVIPNVGIFPDDHIMACPEVISNDNVIIDD